MAEVLLFHHAQGLTRGCLAFADRLRDAGDRHLFADESLPDYDEDAAALLTERALDLLEVIE